MNPATTLTSQMLTEFNGCNHMELATKYGIPVAQVYHIIKEACCERYANPKPRTLLRCVSADKTVSINDCLYSTPHAEAGAIVQLTPLNGGWLYQVQHELPQSTFASPDPLHSPTDTGRAGCTHTHSGNWQTSNKHDAIAAHLDEATAPAHRSSRIYHTAATVMGHASPSTCPWCGGELRA